MKKLALLFALTALVGCGSDNKPNQPMMEDTIRKEVVMTAEEKIKFDVKNFIDKQIASTKKVTNILSGFTFAMHQNEVDEHTTRMMKKNVLKKVKVASDRYEYVYQFPLTDKIKADTYMDAAYQKDGRLYKMVCKMKTPTGSSTAAALAQTKAHLATLYGEPAFTLPSYSSCDHYLWIDGNMHIDLKCELSGVQFVYTDLAEEKPVPQLDMAATQVEVTETKHSGH